MIPERAAHGTVIAGCIRPAVGIKSHHHVILRLAVCVQHEIDLLRQLVEISAPSAGIAHADDRDRILIISRQILRGAVRTKLGLCTGKTFPVRVAFVLLDILIQL